MLRSPRIRVSALCVALAASAACPAFAAKDTFPDWVRAAAAQPKGTYPQETSAVVLLDDTILTVGADGKAVERHRHVVRILRPSGRDEGYVHVAFDKDTKILNLHVWSIGPDGHEYTLSDKDFSEIGAGGSGGQLYEDVRFKVAEPPGRDPGGVIAYESEQRKEPYIHEATWYFQDDIPHVHQSFTLELPAGYTYGTVWAHHPVTTATDLEGGKYRWEFDQMPAITLDRVPMHPSLGALMPRMTVHYAPSGPGSETLGTWQGIGEWWDGLAHDRTQATPDIAAKAAELTAGKTDFYDKAEAIGEFVQKQIRYFVIEMGVGGFQPHPAADIFRNRYGDCKDKATLLSAMLSSVGIHSAIMMVDTRRGVIDPESPSIVGNHAIGAIEIPKGYDSPKLRSVVTSKSGRRYLIFDPTWEKTAFGQLEHNLQGGYGVLFEAKDSQIIQLPVLNPNLNTVSRSATFQLQADGTFKGAIVEKRFGDLSENRRDLFTSADASQQSKEIDRVLAHDLVNFTVSDLKVENAQALNKDLTTTFKVQAERYGRIQGPLLMLRPRVLGSESMTLEHKKRSVPFDLRQTMTANDDFTIQIPDGYAVDELPDPIDLDLGFASYKSSSKLDGNLLHYTRTYTVRQVTLPADRYADVEKLAQTIDSDEQNNAVFKKK